MTDAMLVFKIAKYLSVNDIYKKKKEKKKYTKTSKNTVFELLNVPILSYLCFQRTLLVCTHCFNHK